jgi:hypothetical protein
LSVYPFVCLSVYKTTFPNIYSFSFSFCLSIRSSVCLFTKLLFPIFSFSFFLMSVCLSVCPNINLSVNKVTFYKIYNLSLFFCLSMSFYKITFSNDFSCVFLLSVHLSICPSVYLPTRLSAYPFVL